MYRRYGLAVDRGEVFLYAVPEGVMVLDRHSLEFWVYPDKDTAIAAAVMMGENP